MQPVVLVARPSLMRRPLIAVLIFLLLVSGCGSSAADDHHSAPRDGSIAVSTHLDKTGGVFIEGAVAEVTVRDPSGRRVRTVADLPGRTLRIDRLARGDYEVEPALRPCSGNCADPRPERLATCSANVQVDNGVTRLRVVYRVGERCRIRAAS